jgi:hypothetical protein
MHVYPVGVNYPVLLVFPVGKYSGSELFGVYLELETIE